MPIPSVVGFNSPSLAELWFSNEVRVLPSPSSPTGRFIGRTVALAWQPGKTGNFSAVYAHPCRG
jgi:hypothetical protein